MRVRSALIASAAGFGVAGAAAGVGAAIVARGLWKRARIVPSFAGQTAVITGASRGLGFAIAQEFARRGANVVLGARDPQTLHEAEQRLQAWGANVLSVQCDIGERSQAESLIVQATRHFGRVDVLVNNAGQISVGPLRSQTVDDFEEAMRTMFWGMVHTTTAVLPQMRQRASGRIANITSIGGKVAIPHLLPYSCAKFAAVGFSEGLRAELAKDRIKVTTVVPGLMRTGSHVNAIFKGDHRAEYTWFALAATLPFSAMDAHRAARKIVDAIGRGTSELVLTPQARLLARAHGMAPGMVADLLGLVNRCMPGTDSQNTQRFTGKESETLVTRSVLTRMGRSAGRELNQHPEGRPVANDARVRSRTANIFR
jgi:short-subunit dehydrogenase